MQALCNLHVRLQLCENWHTSLGRKTNSELGQLRQLWPLYAICVELRICEPQMKRGDTESQWRQEI